MQSNQLTEGEAEHDTILGDSPTITRGNILSDNYERAEEKRHLLKKKAVTSLGGGLGIPENP